MITLQELTSLINYHANTKILMRGQIDSQGLYAGTIVGSSPEEIYNFLRYIAVARGREFERVEFRIGTNNPPTFTCHIKFDTNEINTNKGYIITDCLYCGIPAQFDSKFAGETVECPNCGKVLVIGMKENTILDFFNNSTDIEIDGIVPQIDISNVYFKASDHKRYNNGEWSGEDCKGSLRAIEIKPDSEFDNSYLVTLYNLSETHPTWGDNFSISPKRMRIISSDKNEITLIGYGNDPMLSKRPPQIQKNYGITIHLQNEVIQYISYYYHDRDVRIDFLE